MLVLAYLAVYGLCMALAGALLMHAWIETREHERAMREFDASQAAFRRLYGRRNEP